MNRVPFCDVADANACAATVRAHLDGGGILAYPTETVYGLGCALDAAALKKLAALKGRDAAKSFLLLAADPFALPGLMWSDAAVALARAFWPGPLTIAVSADAAHYHAPVLSSGNTVAVRQISLAPLRALLEAIGQPITSTSANNAGSPPARSADEVASAFDEQGTADILLLDSGVLGAGRAAATADRASMPPAGTPSTLVDCAGPVPRVLREGAITIAMLRTALTAEGFTIDV